MRDISSSIALTYITTNKRLAIVAALGILIGISVYIFINSMLAGFDTKTNELVFKSLPHINIYKDDEMSKPLVRFKNKTSIIVNPRIVPNSNIIINPKKLIKTLLSQKNVLMATPQVDVSMYYNAGKSQLPGVGIGIVPDEANVMYDIKSSMVDGNYDMLKSTLNGIIVGNGVAQKMNLGIGQTVSLSSSKGVVKSFKVVGIFKTNNSSVDKKTSYLNLNSAQQLMQESSTFVSDISVKVDDFENATKIAKKLSILTSNKVEGWKEANASLVAASKIRKMILTFVSLTVLVVAAFGIYNIINMTVSQKINDIAILKAIGFKGKNVIRIFITQAMIMGMMGVLGGVVVAFFMVMAMKTVYISVDVGYFPIYYEPLMFLQGIVVGLGITFLAGYIPAKKASQIDPVKIFRK